MRHILTTHYLNRLRPHKIERFVWDTQLPGYGVRAYPSGTITFLAQVWDVGRTRRTTLGRHPDLSEAEARCAARTWLQEQALGDDIALQPDKPFPDFAEEFFIRYARHWKPRTLATSRYCYQRELLPAFGYLTVGAITRADVMQWFTGLAHRPGVANRALPVLSVMLREAEIWNYRPKGSQPCKNIKRYARPEVGHYLTAEELIRLGAVLREQAPLEPVLAALCRTLLYTGARVGELVNLRWTDYRAGHLHLLDSKTGPRTVYLSPAARRVLEAVPRIGTWVFPDPSGNKPLTTKQAGKHWRMLREKADLAHVRLHDLRHTFASLGIAAGLHLVTLSHLLGHALPESTLRYTHLASENLQEATDGVTQALAAALAEGEG